MIDVNENEQGFALILTLFVIALATILVLDFSAETLAYQKLSRAHTERLQADYMLKSTMNVARLLLELPKLQELGDDGSVRTISEDWLGEPWALVAAAPVLLGFPGNPRLTIVDESGKIDLNAIASANNRANIPPTNQNQANPNTGTGLLADNIFWMDAMSKLFSQAGFVRERYEEDTNRTLGDAGYSADDQVAVIHDWIDADRNSHSAAGFPGEGIESSNDKTWFYNRPLRSITELAAVPGMTLERLSRVAPFLRINRRTGSGNSRININTAPRSVLLALGFEETQVLEIVEQRSRGPISAAQLQTLVAGNPFLSRNTTTRSSQFTAYARVEYANVTRWAKALIEVQGGAQRRRTTIRSIEIN